MRKLQLGVLALAILAVVTLVPAASASVIGTFSVANCTGDGVTVTLTSIDFLPAGGGTGCIETGTGTSVVFSGGTLGVGVAGTINDLPVNGNTGFMMFPSAPGLFFDLVTLGPGPSNTNCASLTTGQSCAVAVGSPFILTKQIAGTSITLSVSGTARDAISSNSIWMGSFTTQFPGLSPGTIQTTILGGGAETNTFSGSFIASAVPEPFTLAMIGGGLIALASFRKRRVHQ
jgi:hypothetical protein